MLPAKRQAQILEHLRQRRFASLPDLAGLVGSSTSTVRRDVDLLCEQGHLSRTHGGAALREGESATLELAPDLSDEIARPQKERIGRRAAELIDPGASVLFDSGSTTMATARAALERGVAFTAITNDVRVAALLALSAQIDVHVPGGQVRPRSATLLGASCMGALSRLSVDLAVIGAHKVDPSGASETSIDHAEVKRAIMAAAGRSVLVADAGKFPGRSLCRFAPLSAFDRIVTDDGLHGGMRRELEQAGLALEVVT